MGRPIDGGACHISLSGRVRKSLSTGGGVDRVVTRYANIQHIHLVSPSQRTCPWPLLPAPLSSPPPPLPPKRALAGDARRLRRKARSVAARIAPNDRGRAVIPAPPHHRYKSSGIRRDARRSDRPRGFVFRELSFLSAAFFYATPGVVPAARAMIANNRMYARDERSNLSNLPLGDR